MLSDSCAQNQWPWALGRRDGGELRPQQDLWKKRLQKWQDHQEESLGNASRRSWGRCFQGGASVPSLIFTKTTKPHTHTSVHTNDQTVSCILTVRFQTENCSWMMIGGTEKLGLSNDSWALINGPPFFFQEMRNTLKRGWPSWLRRQT